MATPTRNAVIVTDVNPASGGGGRYTISGEKWGGSLGQGVTLTYSFPGTSAYYATPYGQYYDAGEWKGKQALTSGEKAAVVTGLAAWSAVANIKFAPVSDTSTVVGELRFAKTSYDTDWEYGHAYLPSTETAAGDVWFSTANWNAANAASVAKGSDDWHTALHEIGHAIGLKHTFDTPYALPTTLDSYFYSVMSYSARDYDDSGWASFYPTTPMYYDLLGIQALYGRNTKHNADNTVYTFNEGQTYFQTIDDAAGIDRIVYVGTNGVLVNLVQGKFSTLSAPISFDSGSTSATVAIGPRSVIEHATGGTGADRLYGNSSANSLSGRAGSDIIVGAAGNDSLSGGDNNDRLYGDAGNDRMSGGAGTDAFYFRVAPTKGGGTDTIYDYNVADDSIYLDDAAFARLPAGALASGHFYTGAAAHDRNDYVIYNDATGALIYDSNGSYAGGAAVIAILSKNLALTAADIVVY